MLVEIENVAAPLVDELGNSGNQSCPVRTGKKQDRSGWGATWILRMIEQKQTFVPPRTRGYEAEEI